MRGQRGRIFHGKPVCCPINHQLAQAIRISKGNRIQISNTWATKGNHDSNTSVKTTIQTNVQLPFCSHPNWGLSGRLAGKTNKPTTTKIVSQIYHHEVCRHSNQHTHKTTHTQNQTSKTKLPAENCFTRATEEKWMPHKWGCMKRKPSCTKLITGEKQSIFQININQNRLFWGYGCRTVKLRQEIYKYL